MTETIGEHDGEFKAGAPWFKCFPRDWRNGTSALTPEQRGIYFDCLCYLYEFERPIPEDDKWVACHFHVSPRLWRSIRAALVAAGKLVKVAGGWTNVRAQVELESRSNQSRAKRELALNRERAKREKSKNANSNKDADTTNRPQDNHYAHARQITDNRIHIDKTSSSVLAVAARVPSRAAPPDDFVDRLIEAAQPCLDNPTNCMGLLNCGVPQMWLNEGYDLDRDILPVLRAAAVKHKGKRIRDWTYFSGMIADASTKRTAGTPARTITKKAEPPTAFYRAQDQAALEAAKERIALEVMAEERAYLASREHIQ